MAKAKRRLLDLAVRALPDAVEGDVRRALGLEVKVAPKAARKAAPKALPAPPKRLALPAPGPGLPPQASKPRGGQFWVDKDFDGSNVSPEEAARQGALSMGIKTMQWQPDPDYGVIDLGDPAARMLHALETPMVPKTDKSPEQQWLERALTKYYKNEFGSPDDPLRGLAERGVHYDPEMTPEKWQATVNSYLMEDPIQSIMFPPNLKGGMPGAGSDLRGEALAAMPWLAKQPVTDKIYGISGGGLDLEHFTDELYNALNPEISGLPMEFAVRPESLNRMTFAQAAERVGKINQYRAKEMERAALSAQDNPAISLFKEYADDNPMGLRWVELKAPDLTPETLPEGWRRDGDYYVSPKGDYLQSHPNETAAERALSEALKYEGDTMGHCVGGYCPDVMSGRSRIFSLRDAKGEPHVTIETKPAEKPFWAVRLNDLEPGLWDEVVSQGESRNVEKWLQENRPDLFESFSNEPAEDIIQIKGKQNRAPKDDYLPFVQDFVKSQKWGNVGDLSNTGLVRLPDGRYITAQQAQEALSGIEGDIGTLDARYLDRLGEDAWAKIAPNFEGFAIGGRVDADRCFCHNPLSVKKGR